MCDHGGNLDRAMAERGGARSDWIDLSTGINRVPYPVPALPDHAWRDLPTRADLNRLRAAARHRYGARGAVLPLAGAQAAIQLIPHLTPPAAARILAPTYNEHAACLHAAGWQVTEVPTPDALAGADLAVLVNPNNPDGRIASAETIAALAGKCGRVVVDESFADTDPDLSLASELEALPNVLVLRSFGKFYGLAGLRLGFVLGADAAVADLAAMAGPWPVSGAAIEIGCRALADEDWLRTTRARLRADADRIDGLAMDAGWSLVGGTDLFRLYETGAASAAQTRLAGHRIWSRTFPWSPGYLRLGLPGTDAEWDRLAHALS